MSQIVDQKKQKKSSINKSANNNITFRLLEVCFRAKMTIVHSLVGGVTIPSQVAGTRASYQTNIRYYLHRAQMSFEEGGDGLDRSHVRHRITSVLHFGHFFCAW